MFHVFEYKFIYYTNPLFYNLYVPYNCVYRWITTIVLCLAYLDDGDYNVIGVDWSRLVKAPWYSAAASHTKVSGGRIAMFIDFLVSTGVSLDSIHIIGHSLGAHAAGYAASNIKSGKIHRVTGIFICSQYWYLKQFYLY